MPCRQLVRSSPIVFLLTVVIILDSQIYIFLKPLYKFHVEKSWISDNEASKQNLSQQWIAEWLINHNFSFNKTTEIIFLQQLYADITYSTIILLNT